LAGGLRRVGALAALGGLALIALVGGVLLDAGWRGVDAGYEAILKITEATTDNTTLSGRTTLWGILIGDLSLDNVYGYGIGGARYYLRTVNPWFTHSHNSALETIYTSGYLGLIAMIGAFGSALLSCFHSWRSPRVRVLTTAGLYVIAVGMMNPSWYDTSSVVVMSILCSLRLMPTQLEKAAPASSHYGYARSFAN